MVTVLAVPAGGFAMVVLPLGVSSDGTELPRLFVEAFLYRTDYYAAIFAATLFAATLFAAIPFVVTTLFVTTLCIHDVASHKHSTTS
jgi:hypothetical protein